MIRENKKLPHDVTGKIPEIVEAISGDPDVVALFSFGSLAEGRLTPLSDLDFAVLVSKRLTERQRFEKHIELIGVFNSVLRTDEIDLVVLNDTPLKFGHRILKTGKLLCLRNKEELIDFSEKVVKLYLDFRFFETASKAPFSRGRGIMDERVLEHLKRLNQYRLRLLEMKQLTRDEFLFQLFQENTIDFLNKHTHG